MIVRMSRFDGKYVRCMFVGPSNVLRLWALLSLDS